MLILCGSLIGMMQKHALSYDSPLYGRRTAQIRLAPLSFPDVYAAQHLSFERAVKQYAITGGVPKYLEFFNDQEGLLEPRDGGWKPQAGENCGSSGDRNFRADAISFHAQRPWLCREGNAGYGEKSGEVP